jgi:energy-coupling factor transporter ATP-binding protein EcfA2
VYLKRIVLHGFKSFADRTEFDFGPGVTAVVGPNGCGKSNLLDAVRWVLGEQSARSLRGKRMSDVIFAGSRSRKPAAAAQVELVFDNSAGFLATDEPEVSISRVLYRSGDSDYRMNGNSCRLKDIRQLFLDTGVGVDAYSIIEQGRVDLLLQADPMQRREIFEEAAGISRYKQQRAEAQRKLERSQNNLLRLNDIIDELERQLRSVKLAAGKARRWQEYDRRLRELRASFSLAEYHELETGCAGVRAQMAEHSDRLQAERATLAAHDAAAAQHERADTADGFFSARPRDRILEIMRDSRIGSMGVAAIVSVVALKIVLVASVPGAWRLWVLLLMPVAGRCALLVHLALLPYARPEGGLADLFHANRSRGHILWALLFLLGSGWLSGGWPGMAAGASAFVLTLPLAAWSLKKIGGLTGDTLGAACELTELAPALVAVALFKGGFQ